MRRFLTVLFATLLTLPLGAASIAAQGATPASGLGDYPEVAVTITEHEVQVASDQIPAGYIRLAVTNQSAQENGVGLVALPEGQSLEQLAQATPAPGNFIPPFFYDATIAGGPTSIPSGETWSQVVHVDPGQWIVFAQNDQQPVPVTVAETEASVTTAPTADATITESDFTFTGFGQLQAGAQVLEVANAGEQPHMLDFFQVPDGTTLDQVMAAISAPEDATPAPGGLQESDITLVPGGQVIMQSSGTSAWMDVDLTPGTYVAVCFVIDPATGMPHAMEGMVSLFEVGGAAATPAS
ncbi:MAG TPA: hypothetical protein VNZ55_07115 [Thermomicrobiales bacterium]|nr:hypothetical protein [Thermomicrobiales bacterium]